MYTDMMQDNARYTAMRLFQDIEDSEVIYINTYAATTPRLSAFKAICSSAKDNGEDYVDPADEDDSADSEPMFSRDLFRLGSQWKGFWKLDLRRITKCAGLNLKLNVYQKLKWNKNNKLKTSYEAACTRW